MILVRGAIKDRSIVINFIDGANIVINFKIRSFNLYQDSDRFSTPCYFSQTVLFIKIFIESYCFINYCDYSIKIKIIEFIFEALTKFIIFTIIDFKFD